MRILYLLYVFIFIVFTGCSSHRAVVNQALDQYSLAVTGNVIDPQMFVETRTMAIRAFKPGPRAEASDQVDGLCEKIIQGIRDGLAQSPTSLILVEDPSGADLVLDGYIEEFTPPGKIQRLIFRKRQAHLTIDGEIWFQRTGAKVLVFSSSKVIDMKRQKPLESAYDSGRAIGDFIGSSINATKE